MTLILALFACAPDYKDVSAKVVGVGYDPEQIGPSPTPYGGVVEYTWVNFAGGGLSLALMQLGSFDEVGPAMVGYAPPYAAVYGFSYIFTEKLGAADSLGGVTSVPPSAEETCYTTYEATGPIGSFKTVDVGDYMEFVTKDGTGGLRLDRNPAQYLMDPSGAFAYYSGLDLWNSEPLTALKPVDGDKQIEDMESVVVRKASFPSGKSVTYKFPGAMVPAHAPLGSIPAPSSLVNETSMTVPSLPGGVQVEWAGPTYDNYGFVQENSGPHSTCLAFVSDAVDPQGPSECVNAMTASGDNGQMYTGPWDTEDGEVKFRWEPGSNPDEIVSLAVRFLGPVDQKDPNFMREVKYEDVPRSVKATWNTLKGKSVPDVDPPLGVRAPNACEQGAEYEFDPNYLTAAGELIPSMRGDPFHNMAEVTCRLADDGEFALTTAIVADALDYARAHGSQGAIFYFARSTEAEVEVPDAMDNYGDRKVISPIAVASRAVDIGRFWFEE